MSIRDFKSIKERREYIEKIRKLKFDAINIYPNALVEAARYNCENMIGSVQIPLGVAGPLSVSGEYAKGEFYIPLATSEGALVASINRGCKAVTASGGASVVVEEVGMTRGPVFQTGGIKEGMKFKKWLDDNFEEIARISESTSSHLKLIKLESSILGRHAYVRFCFTTSDAMGMNMVTIATQEIVEFIKKQAKIHCISLAGNYDTDKKPSWLNFIKGRGKKVWAEAILSERIVIDVLKTTSSKIHEVATDKCLLGSVMSGSLGFNSHFANIVAAIFIACGQDAAHTVEGSLGITTTQVNNHGLYISVYLPDVCLGTVGGGTRLPAQKEALVLLGVAGGVDSHNALKFAEVLGGAVLAGELSLLAALSEGSLAASHKRYARGK